MSIIVFLDIIKYNQEYKRTKMSNKNKTKQT